MKLNKYISGALCLGLMAISTTGCSEDFLKEENIRQQGTEIFQTQAGLDQLAAAAYMKFRVKTYYDPMVSMYALGTDEFTAAADAKKKLGYDDYSNLFSSTDGYVAAVWDWMYALVEYSNILINNLPQYYDQNDAQYNVRWGEAHFFRGWAYYTMVCQMGGVPLKLAPSTSVETAFTRNSEKECWEQIIADFEVAYANLPASSTEWGRARKTAAAHYLALAHLWRASERYKALYPDHKPEADLQAVIKYSDEVIAAHPLTPDYATLWDYTGRNCANEMTSEIILSAQYGQEKSEFDRFENQSHNGFLTSYDNFAGITRDTSGGRPYNRNISSQYVLYVFDHVNDSRFWKSFITAYNCNRPDNIPTWTEADINSGCAPEGAVEGQPRFALGDVALKYVVNMPGDKRYTPYIIDDANNPLSKKNGVIDPVYQYVCYYDGEQMNWNDFNSMHGSRMYQMNDGSRGVALCKFRDGSREGFNDNFGRKDFYLARSAEDYLMAAEAYVRLSQFDKALGYINALRTRAAYKSGEDRSFHTDGGKAYLTNPNGNVHQNGTYKNQQGPAVYSETNTYYESNGDMAITTESTVDQMQLTTASALNNPVDKPILDRLNLSGEQEKWLHFILNERSRELAGELIRWDDLSRTMTLEKRYKAFNQSATRANGATNFNASKHYYRPIPQTFLDNITNPSGEALSDEEKNQMQNNGW